MDSASQQEPNNISAISNKGGDSNEKANEQNLESKDSERVKISISHENSPVEQIQQQTYDNLKEKVFPQLDRREEGSMTSTNLQYYKGLRSSDTRNLVVPPPEYLAKKRFSAFEYGRSMRQGGEKHNTPLWLFKGIAHKRKQLKRKASLSPEKQRVIVPEAEKESQSCSENNDSVNTHNMEEKSINEEIAKIQEKSERQGSLAINSPSMKKSSKGNQVEGGSGTSASILPYLQKRRVLVVCQAEIDGEIKENKPLYFPGLNWLKDLRMSVIGPQDIKVLHNSI